MKISLVQYSSRDGGGREGAVGGGKEGRWGRGEGSKENQWSVESSLWASLIIAAPYLGVTSSDLILSNVEKEPHQCCRRGLSSSCKQIEANDGQHFLRKLWVPGCLFLQEENIHQVSWVVGVQSLLMICYFFSHLVLHIEITNILLILVSHYTIERMK